ncbi:MAG: tRNA pseudouridine(55) synthase TruB [Burkholderiales bacterium]|nr:tRNA pseudouridine(55) synthase TruB [Burkholderiales bacterium]
MTTQVKKTPRVPVHGVLLLDKPVGWSSNDALIKAKRLLNALKAGHTGTLDPFATGLLPLCFGEATKFSQDLLEADKTYQTVVHLGVTTNTGDTEGEVLQTLPVEVTVTQIEEVLGQFRGDILQVPPMYSALKRDGKPLYEYARAGITLEREARPVTIHLLEFVSYEAPLTLEALTAMDESQRAQLLAPVDALLSSFPAVLLSDDLARRFLQGQRLALGKEEVQIPEQFGRVRVYRESNRQLLGSAQLQEYAILAPERLISTV